MEFIGCINLGFNGINETSNTGYESIERLVDTILLKLLFREP